MTTLLPSRLLAALSESSFAGVRPEGQASPLRRPAGFSLVELMVALALGLIIMGTLTAIFVSSSRSRQEIEKTDQQIENGHFATQLLLDDLRLAGYYGEFSPASLATPATLPDPALSDAASLSAAIALPVQGYDGGTGLSVPLAAMLADLRAGSDVLVLRRASTCVAGTAGCLPVDMTRNTYFQTTLCNNQLSVLPAASQFLIGTTSSQFDTNNAAVTGSASPPTFLARKDCLTAAVLRAFFTRFYFLANNNRSADGIPTLKMVELGAGSFNITPLVEGIDQLQFEYGRDTNGDGAPDLYTPSPASAAEWRQVTVVKIHLLARNTLSSGGFVDSRSYSLGRLADGSENVFGPFNDAFKRHVYSTTVRLNNVAGRLE